VGYLDLPPIPIETFNLCLMLPRFQFKLVPYTIATVFGDYPCSFSGVKIPTITDREEYLDVSAFIVVAWCIFHNMRALKISTVIRTIATDTTVYFVVMVAVQVYSQLSYIFMEV